MLAPLSLCTGTLSQSRLRRCDTYFLLRVRSLRWRKLEATMGLWPSATQITQFDYFLSPPCVLGSLSPIHAHTSTVRHRRCALAENEPHTQHLRLGGLVHGYARRRRGGIMGPLPCTLWPRDRRFAPFTMCWPRCWRGRWISGRLGVEHFRFVLCHTSGFFITGAGENEDGSTHRTQPLFSLFFFIGRSGLCPTPHLTILIHCC